MPSHKRSSSKSHPPRRDLAATANAAERERLGIETLLAAAELVLAAQRRMEAFNDPGDDSDGAAQFHYGLALEAMGWIALSLIHPKTDSHLGRACEKLRALHFGLTPGARRDEEAIQEARRAVFGEVMAMRAIAAADQGGEGGEA